MGLNETVFQHTEHENQFTASECIRTCAPHHRRAALTSLPGMSRKSESDLSQEEVSNGYKKIKYLFTKMSYSGISEMTVTYWTLKKTAIDRQMRVFISV